MNDPRALKDSRCVATRTAMKRARNHEFRALWRRIYQHLVCDDPVSLDESEAVCMDISARDEFNKPLP